MKHRLRKPGGIITQNGDTIVEVLIAIAIAAFAVGVSYSTAQRSLQQAIAAREHNQAVNILESQVADLNYRFQQDTHFNSDFASQPNFCLGDNAQKSTDTGWIYPGVPANSTPETPPYNAGCQTTNGGANYFANIIPHGVPNNFNSTTYTITVRWYRLGGGINQATLYYKLNNSQSQGLSFASANPNNPPNCSDVPPDTNENDTSSPPRLFLGNQSGHYVMYQVLNPTWTPNPSCTYTITITAKVKTLAQLADPHSQMFAELCSNVITDCDTTNSLGSQSANPAYRTPGLSNDVIDPSTLSRTTSFSISNLNTPIKYIVIKHCSVEPPSWTSPSPSDCQGALNVITDYDVIITG